MHCIPSHFEIIIIYIALNSLIAGYQYLINRKMLLHVNWIRLFLLFLIIFFKFYRVIAARFISLQITVYVSVTRIRNLREA